jgi:uncharacterized protein
MTSDVDRLRISELESLLKRVQDRDDTRSNLWNPPYCGDIGLAIAGDGTWSYRGSAIGRMPLVKLFASVLRCEEDGRHYLVTPAEKVDVAVTDAPFIAVEMEVRGSGRAQELLFRTNVDDVVVCDGDHPLRFVTQPDGAVKPYVRVRGRLDALVSRALTYDLLEMATASAEATPGVWSGGVWHPLPPF